LFPPFLEFAFTVDFRFFATALHCLCSYMFLTRRIIG
jgi:hypothetical protein